MNACKATSMRQTCLRSGSRATPPICPPSACRGRVVLRPAAVLADAAAVEQTLFVSQQLYSFCSTLTGFVAVASTAHCLAQLLKSNKLLAQSSTALADTAAPAPALETISFDASAMAVDIVKDAVATPPAAAAMPTPLSDIDDIRAELQRAAEAAVAAIASEAAAPSARRPVAPAAAADPVPTKAGSEQKLTAEDATRQVQEWIAAWGSKSEGAEDADEGSLPPVPASVIAASAAAPVMTDVTPATAAAVLNAMTANVPVGLTAETPVATDAPVAAAEEAVLVLAAAGAQAPVADYQEDAAAAADRAYRERIAAALTDSPAATVGAKARTSVVEVLQSKAVTVGVEYQSKIDALWRESEARRAAEEALLARSERVLAELAQQDEAERAADAPAVAAATQAEGTGVLARLLAFFSAIWAAVTRSFASLFGGSGSAPAAA